MMFGYGAGWYALMVVGMIVVFALLTWAAYVLLGATTRRGYGPGRGFSAGTAREVLDGRLARGEIDTEEYRHLLDAMGAGNRGRHDAGS